MKFPQTIFDPFLLRWDVALGRRSDGRLARVYVHDARDAEDAIRKAREIVADASVEGMG